MSPWWNIDCCKVSRAFQDHTVWLKPQHNYWIEGPYSSREAAEEDWRLGRVRTAGEFEELDTEDKWEALKMYKQMEADGKLGYTRAPELLEQWCELDPNKG